MLNPTSPENIHKLVGWAKQELRWAVNNKDDLPRISVNIKSARDILKKLILPVQSNTLGEEFVAQFVNGEEPTGAIELDTDPYDGVSLGNNILKPGEIVEFRHFAESYRYADTYFGAGRLVGVRAMALSVPFGGRLEVNPDEDGIYKWLDVYERIHRTSATSGHV